MLMKFIKSKKIIVFITSKQIITFISSNQVVVSTTLKQIILLTNSTKSFVAKISNNERISKKFRIEIDFELFEKLIYYTRDETRRLCFFINIENKIFRLIHDENIHVEVHRCFNKIINIFYISRLSKKIDVTSNIVLIIKLLK